VGVLLLGILLGNDVGSQLGLLEGKALLGFLVGQDVGSSVVGLLDGNAVCRISGCSCRVKSD
jgi:hypothetical protein